MTKRIFAIFLIFVCTSIAWAILGTTIFTRTYSSDSIASNQVASLWGSPQTQAPPVAFFKRTVPRTQESTENGKKIVKTIQEEVITPLPLEGSAIDVGLDLEHRQKGLLWYSTYKVGFAGVYRFRNPSDKEETVIFELKFPESQAIYDDLDFAVNDLPVATSNQHNTVSGSVKIPAGSDAKLSVGYGPRALMSGAMPSQCRIWT